MQTLVKLTDNTHSAILEAANNFVEGEMRLVEYGVRKTNIKQGVTKFGDVDVSTLEDLK